MRAGRVRPKAIPVARGAAARCARSWRTCACQDQARRATQAVYAGDAGRVLISHPQIRDVTVAGKRDPRWGELMVAVVAVVAVGRGRSRWGRRSLATMNRTSGADEFAARVRSYGYEQGNFLRK